MYIDILDVKIQYDKYGTGEMPVLLLHGWGGDYKSLESIGNMIKDKHTVYALTFPTQYKNNALNMNQYLMLVKEFIVQLNIKKCIIICHSFGARVALMLSAQYPDIVEKLVIISGAGIKPRFNLITYLKIKKYKLLKKLNLLKHNNYGSSDYKLLNDVQKQTFKNIVNTDLTKYSYYIECPTLLIWGNKDKQTPIYMAKKLQKNIKNSKLEIVKNCGHFVYLENYTKCINLIQEFLC